MSRNLILFLILLFSQNFYAQINDTICDLEKKNVEWKANFEKLKDLNSKIIEVQSKLIADTNYPEFKPEQKIVYAHKVEIKNDITDKNGNSCDCKIQFVVANSKDTKFLNLILNPELKEIIDKFNPTTVEKIDYAFGEKAVEVYGSRAKCGLVLIKIKDKKLLREINKTVL